GTYQFRLTVTDNAGAIGTDEVSIVVKPAVAGGGGGGTGSGKTLKFDSYNNAYYPNGTGLDWKPGDTIYIPAGTYGLIDLGNIRGTAAQPIIITNRGGQVVLNQVRFNNKMENFKFLGNGTPGVQYGFKIDQKTEEISFAATTVSNMEVAFVEVNKGAVGMMIKKNPVAGDASTQYGAYTIRNIKVHHCYIHDTKTEGMYIGSTTPSGTAAGIPIRLENVEVSFNKLDRTGWDGIQMSSTLGSNSIHDNVVTNFGTLNYPAQQTGIAIGSAATGDIYNNTITNGTGWGINCMGFGTLKVYNNNIDGAGKNGSAKGAEGIYADDRIAGPENFPKQQMIVTGNTIRNPQPKGAIRVGAYTNNSLPATVSNNRIYLPNAPSNWLTLYIVSNALGSILSNNVLIFQ
ncbi:MAG: right-handed parallel beta-helix repeat-containing protein, partial [Chitinophagaceae bacterium]